MKPWTGFQIKLVDILPSNGPGIEKKTTACDGFFFEISWRFLWVYSFGVCLKRGQVVGSELAEG